MDTKEGPVPESVQTCLAYTGAIGVNTAEEATCLNDRVCWDGQGDNLSTKYHT